MSVSVVVVPERTEQTRTLTLTRSLLEQMGMMKTSSSSGCVLSQLAATTQMR